MALGQRFGPPPPNLPLKKEELNDAFEKSL